MKIVTIIYYSDLDSILTRTSNRVPIPSMQHPEFSHKTYFSENALLPGLVRGEFNDERAIMAYLDDLKYVAGFRLFCAVF